VEVVRRWKTLSQKLSALHALARGVELIEAVCTDDDDMLGRDFSSKTYARGAPSMASEPLRR